MQRHEAVARSSVADALELAIASGELVPGASGWKGRQRAVAQTHLQAPRLDLGGEWRDAAGDRWSLGSYELTPTGRAFGLQALHARATAARTSPMD